MLVNAVIKVNDDLHKRYPDKYVNSEVRSLSGKVLTLLLIKENWRDKVDYHVPVSKNPEYSHMVTTVLSDKTVLLNDYDFEVIMEKPLESE